jgi:hypothetical protein
MYNRRRAAVGVLDLSRPSERIERPRRRRATWIRGRVQCVKRAVGVARFALRGVRNGDGRPSASIWVMVC